MRDPKYCCTHGDIGHCPYCETAEHAAEIATLRAELSMTRGRYEHWFKEATTLRADNERLLAFVSVADELRDSIRMGTENKRKVIAVCDYDIARAALAEDKQ